MNQQEFRKNLTQLILDELDELGYPLIGDCVYGQWKIEDPALDKAMREAYNSLQLSLRKLSRLGVRLDYLEKGDK